MAQENQGSLTEETDQEMARWWSLPSREVIDDIVK